MSEQSHWLRRLPVVGRQIGVALVMTCVALFVFIQIAEARQFRGAGAGNCGKFIDAVAQAQDDDVIVQMREARSTDSAVLTKSITVQGGWNTPTNCDVQNQVFTSTQAMLDAGFVYLAPAERSALFNFDAPVLTIAPPVKDLTLENLDLNKDASGNLVAVGAVISGSITNGARVLLDNVVLRDSKATSSGGALYLEVRGGSRLEIRNSQFLRNTAAAGGGLDLHVYDNSTVVIQDTLFKGNRASAGVGGAGRIVLHSGTVQIVGVTFEDNEASVSGGALAIVGAGMVDLYDSTLSSFNLTGTQFINNRALGDGAGALFLANGNSTIVNALFVSNEAANPGPAIQFVSPGKLTILHTTIASPIPNSKSAIAVAGDGSVTIQNTIISGHAIGIETAGTGTVFEDYNLFYGNGVDSSGSVTSGGHKRVGDPAFADPTTFDYHLTVDSAAINRGVDVGVAVDFEGEPRPQASAFDIGYDESPFSSQYELAVSTSGAGSGAVGSNPPGINCGGDCDEAFKYGAVVTLTVNAATGSTFAGWGGACGGSGACSVTMDAPKSVTATFALINYQLTTATAGTGSGSISLNPPGGTYPHGTVVAVTATPATGSTFTGWSGACTGSSACNVTMAPAKTVTATFTLNSYALFTATAGTGSGSISLNPPGGTYPHGTVVAVTATPATGSTFTGWSGACTGSSTCSVTMAAAKAVTATFSLNSYALTTATVGTGSGSVSLNPAGSTYSHGTVVAVTAAPAAGSTFIGWGGACAGSGTCNVSMDGDKTVTASFDLASGAGVAAYLPLIMR